MAVSKPSAISLFDNIKKDITSDSEKKNTVKGAVPTKRAAAAKSAAQKPGQKVQDVKEKTAEGEAPVKTPVREAVPAGEPKRRGGGKSTPATFYMTPEVLDMIRTASKAYGGNGSLYIRNLIAKDYAENGKTYEALPDLMF